MVTNIYRDKLRQKLLNADAAQAKAVDELQRLHDELIEQHELEQAGWLQKMTRAILGRSAAPAGIYLWGDVGRGKTLLMNMFYQTLPIENKVRLHFHHFMLGVHGQLATLQRSGRNQKNPLKVLARDYARRYRVICLDEFIVTNITDAMLLYGLLDALIYEGVVLIATSNRIPDDLYLNGLQRERFLPAIELIKRQTQVIHLDSDKDHRLELLEHHHLYHTPLNDDTSARMTAEFDSLASDMVSDDNSITLHKREIDIIARTDEIIWFDFGVLCEAPRATPDYISIAEQYDTVMLSNVPMMNEDMDDKARRFIYLVDELYDKNVILIMSAASGVDALYSGDMLAFAFRRTRSRLIEMQSERYLANASRH